MARYSAIASFMLLLPAAPAVANDEVTAIPLATYVAPTVTIRTPPGATRPMLGGGFKQAVPTREQIPGLACKFLVINGDSFGGMSFSKDRASADGWDIGTWNAKARATYGSEPQLTYFGAPVQIDSSAR